MTSSPKSFGSGYQIWHVALSKWANTKTLQIIAQGSKLAPPGVKLSRPNHMV